MVCVYIQYVAMYYIYVVGLHGLASLYGAYSRSRGEPLHNKLWLQNVIILVNNNLFLLPNFFFFLIFVHIQPIQVQ